MSRIFFAFTAKYIPVRFIHNVTAWKTAKLLMQYRQSKLITFYRYTVTGATGCTVGSSTGFVLHDTADWETGNVKKTLVQQSPKL